MYVSLPQIVTSLQRLGDVHPFFGYAFLGFKKRELPIGQTVEFSYKNIKEDILDKYYRISNQTGYFNPFKSTTSWVSERYESTSLQRVIADTFSGAFLHEKGSSKWGWDNKYIDVLSKLLNKTKTSKIPLLDLTVWLYRNLSLPNRESIDFLINQFRADFHITDQEISRLFDSFVEGRTLDQTSQPVSDIDLLNQLGWPAGTSESSGVVLKNLSLINIGPARDVEYHPATRINLITGDNSLGKTFLLDCAWWAVTGSWMNYAADPLVNRRTSRSEIGYTLLSASGREEQFVAPFNRVESEWQRPDQPIQGLALYTNYSGSFAIWDAARTEVMTRRPNYSEPYIKFSHDAIWNGLNIPDKHGRTTYVSNGLIRDWVTWQRDSGRYEKILAAFEASLRELSPPEGPQLRSGKPAQLPNDARDIPTVRMPYGDVPVLYASAGVQRILSLAYMLVWSWFRHLEFSNLSKREPLTSMIIFIDEIESHLHPRWQRQIIPALMKAIEKLGTTLSVQLHVSTHSPLVLASVEPLFDIERDQIHNLVLEKDGVKLERLKNWKHGSINYWLESESFGLKEARSKPAEQILERATMLQLEKKPSPADVEHVHRSLVRLLPDDDPFWVRWSYFYEKVRSREK
jgi:hypothetical protein